MSMSADAFASRQVAGANRRAWLQDAASGLGGIALASLLQRDSLRAGQPRDGLPHYPPRAKRVIQLFMAGGASHLDLFDYKPELVRRHGQPADFGEPVEAFQDGLGPWLKPIWEFSPYGESGRLLGLPVAALGACADQLAFVHNLVTRTGIHSTSTLLQSTGFQLPGFPAMGCWISYALGSDNDNLPTFVVLPDHRGLASNGTKNWDSAFLSAEHQGTVIAPGDATPIRDLFPIRNDLSLSPDSDLETRAALERLNRRHAASRPGDSRLTARIRSYELAAGLQLAAPDALNTADEPEHILRLYGLDRIAPSFPSTINAEEEAVHFSRKCLVARRLIERGVRFVQIWSGNDNGFPRRNWDSHEDISRDHGPLAEGMARGAAALILDLQQRGLLEDTIIHWTTEFGRMPSSQGGAGRDHNPYVFTNWFAGGGIRGGATVGESDDWGYKPRNRDQPTTVHDVHATLLHLLGIDHTRLTVRHSGLDRRLTDVHGHVLHDLLA
jgi:hypothetical protein